MWRERMAWVALSATLAVLWLWDVGPGGSLRRAELGNLAEYAAAAGMTASVVLLLLERRARRATEARADREAQARQVTAWCLSAIPHGGDFVRYELRVRNNSPLAIYSASIQIADTPKEPGGTQEGLWAVGPGMPGRRSALGPGDVWDTEVTLRTRRHAPFPPHLLLNFTDAAGVRWRRRSSGELEERSANYREGFHDLPTYDDW